MQAAQVSKVPKVDQVPPAPMEASMDSHQDAGKGKEAETLQGKDKGKDKKKDSSKPAEKDSWERLRHYYLSARVSCWPRGSQGKSLGLGLLSFVVFFLLYLLFLYHLFLKEMYHIFAINEDVPILLHTSWYVMQDWSIDIFT